MDNTLPGITDISIASRILLPMCKERNGNGELKYNAEVIIEGLNNFEDEKKMIDYICLLFKEQRKDVFIRVYKEYGKMFLIKMIEKALTIDNEGGLDKKKNVSEMNTDNANENNKRTIGGIFYYLLKYCDEIPKEKLSKIFWRNNKKKHAKRKFNLQFNKMTMV